MVKREVPWVMVAIRDDERAYTLLEKTISPGENGLWQYDDKFRKTGLIHFTCPHCAKVQSIRREFIDRETSSTAIQGKDGKIYQSIWCKSSDVRCGRHLWIRFDGLK